MLAVFRSMAKKNVVWIDQGWMPTAIGYCPSIDAYNATLKQMTGDGAKQELLRQCGQTNLLHGADGKSAVLVVIGEAIKDDPLEIIMTLVHEAVHVWQFICESIGEQSPGIEMEAYSIEAISRGLIDAYMKTTGKGKDWKL